MNSPLFLPALWRSGSNVKAALVAALLATLTIGALLLPSHHAVVTPVAGAAPATTPVSPELAVLARRSPGRRVEVIVQANGPGARVALERRVSRLGGSVGREVTLIQGFGARMSAGSAARLGRAPGVVGVTLNTRVKPSDEGMSGGTVPKAGDLATAFDQSIRANRVWDDATGKGVGVAVIDTGIAGDLTDFRTSRHDATSRLIASAVVNPDATNATDGYGHGTHIAGLIAGNGANRPSSDPLDGRYAGVAPDANLISVKTSDDHGASTVLDVIEGLQFAVDHRADYNIRVVNLSLTSTSAQSASVDPLDAAAEEAWFHGIVVVAAAGNRGDAPDAVQYAPANDPYVITVGAVDDQGTKDISDDQLASWSSRGTTADGVSKPDILVPGAHIVSNLAPGSDFTSLCPDCVRDGAYFQVGGTSMAAGIASGAAADLLDAHPDWTPDQVKGALVKTQRDVAGAGSEVNLRAAMDAGPRKLAANAGLTPSTLIDPATGSIDPTRASWTRASWTDAADPLRASWTRASWTCTCGGNLGGSVDPTRASWTRASWTTSFEK